MSWTLLLQIVLLMCVASILITSSVNAINEKRAVLRRGQQL